MPLSVIRERLLPHHRHSESLGSEQRVATINKKHFDMVKKLNVIEPN
jgi:hypothetical protein